MAGQGGNAGQSGRAGEGGSVALPVKVAHLPSRSAEVAFKTRARRATMGISWTATDAQPSAPLKLPASCGDGNRDPGEECDDGNQMGGDGCSQNCTPREAPSPCGNGRRDQVGNAMMGIQLDGDGCSATCLIEAQPPACGDGNRDPGEECDDGNQLDGDGCSAGQCSIKPNPGVRGMEIGIRLRNAMMGISWMAMDVRLIVNLRRTHPGAETDVKTAAKNVMMAIG